MKDSPQYEFIQKEEAPPPTRVQYAGARPGPARQALASLAKDEFIRVVVPDKESANRERARFGAAARNMGRIAHIYRADNDEEGNHVLIVGLGSLEEED